MSSYSDCTWTIATTNYTMYGIVVGGVTSTATGRLIKAKDTINWFAGKELLE